MDDSVRTLRNNFYLGHFGKVMDEVKEFGDETPAQLSFYYRAALEVKPNEITKINDRSPTALQAIKLLGTYRTAADDTKELVFETLNEWLSDEILGKDETLSIIAAQIFFEEKNYKEALKLVANANENLEKFALAVQIYLKMDRVDLAAKACAAMADVDDDDALTQLCQSWLYTVQGGNKTREASFLLQELIEKFGASTSLLAASAVVQLHLANFAEANQFLKMAKTCAAENKERLAADVLINYIVALHLTKRAPEIIEKLTGELSESYPKHTYLENQNAMSAMFDAHASKYTV